MAFWRKQDSVSRRIELQDANEILDFSRSVLDVLSVSKSMTEQNLFRSNIVDRNQANNFVTDAMHSGVVNNSTNAGRGYTSSPKGRRKHVTYLEFRSGIDPVQSTVADELTAKVFNDGGEAYPPS